MTSTPSNVSARQDAVWWQGGLYVLEGQQLQPDAEAAGAFAKRFGFEVVGPQLA